MSVNVRQWIVSMQVGMRSARRCALAMRVLVVRVVLVFVRMLEHGVAVRVVVAFGDVQPHTKSHQNTGNQ